MRKIFVFFIILICFIAIFIFYKSSPQEQTIQPSQKIKIVKTETKTSPKEDYLFVPYWTINEDISSNEMTLVYFGVMGGKNGIEKNEEGYKNLSVFEKNKNAKNTILVLRMLNTDTNLDILKDKNIQQKIIAETIFLAKKHNFSGIVLDFETQGLPFKTLLESITSMHALFAKQTRLSGLSFATLLFGDTFYRVRPYDVEKIADVVDRVYIMAYDFSKARGDPGPNFPLNGKDIYGYDFKTMVQDFLHVVPEHKITVIFGMFGYDWKIDEKGRGRENAVSKSTIAFEKFMLTCEVVNACNVITDSNKSGETNITYVSGENEDHVIWFENSESVLRKKSYLTDLGLQSVGYWAYSYY
ncbi:MAG: hypothetical protein KBC00_04400 [Candidatus Levybacteria bacterium]|nr:hypothetical protein [Candidatus Levybacteria bacterium]MBP9814850.1 hypothetical protein [Candidatus Levybacteria bacterium]